MNTLSLKYPVFLRFTPGRGKANKTFAVTLVEVGALALVAFLAARFTLALITPVDDGGNPESLALPSVLNASDQREYAVFSRYNPFSATPASVSERDPDYLDAVETTLNISISGAMILEGGRGSAIIKVGSSSEQTFLVGDEIESGVTLERLEPGRAIISRNGILESVTLERNSSDFASGQVSGSVTPQQRSVNPARSQNTAMSLERLSEIFVMRPVRSANGISTGQYVVSAGSDQAAFNRTGLNEGDVISQVNGRSAPQDPESLFEMLDDLKSQDAIALMVNRGGEQIQLSIILSELQ
ncbi:MAG: hypothetical protein MRY72_13395 [Aquisalinus sp.]|nr:hypothetical protein [Aquisalinus sp.]